MDIGLPRACLTATLNLSQTMAADIVYETQFCTSDVTDNVLQLIQVIWGLEIIFQFPATLF